MELRSSRVKGAHGESFDVVTIGGGVHGAAVTRELALRGYRTLLLEARDYAFGTSSRSSKMLHGGIRYLENGQIGLVREALRERSIILSSAPHLGRVQPFLFPIIPGQTRPAWQVKIGLSLYDLLASTQRGASIFPRHHRLERDDPAVEFIDSLGLKHGAVFQYFDGQVDDARVVVEQILDARENGASALNYSPVTSLECSSEGWRVKWRCELSGENFEAKAKFLVNAAGPWVGEISKLGAPIAPQRGTFRFSRGTHLIFDQPWRGPGLILPTPTPGRYYFIWPHISSAFAGTLVGTTEFELSANEDDPQPSEVEIEELLTLLKRDLPQSGLTRDRICGKFAGVRLLYDRGRNNRGGTSDVARSVVYERDSRYIAIIGGKYTTARAVGEDVAREVDNFFGRAHRDRITLERPLPGGRGDLGNSLYELERRLRIAGFGEMAPNIAKNAFSRFGSRVDNLSDFSELGSAAYRGAFRDELRLTILEEDAITVRDVLRRRLGLSLGPDGGKALLPSVIDELVLVGGRPRAEVEREVDLEFG